MSSRTALALGVVVALALTMWRLPSTHRADRDVVLAQFQGHATSTVVPRGRSYRFNAPAAPTFRVRETAVLPLGTVAIEAEGLVLAAGNPLGAASRAVAGVGAGTVKANGVTLHRARELVWATSVGGLAAATGMVRDTVSAKHGLRDRFAAVFRVEWLGHGSSARVTGAVAVEATSLPWLLSVPTRPL